MNCRLQIEEYQENCDLSFTKCDASNCNAGTLPSKRLDIAKQVEAEAAANHTTVLTPLRAKQLLLANLAGAFSQFYGLKIVDGRLALDVGTDTYAPSDYFWSDIKPPGLTFEMTSDGHLVATA